MHPLLRSSRGAVRALSTAAAGARPADVGILAMEYYVPQRFVAQGALEGADGVSAGKYTVGLGQAGMAFVDDREDANSVALTALARLLEGYGLDAASIGRLEVGTESLVDKSKSAKTVLMDLLPGNRSVEGATTLNACYGGTAALLNSAAWVESSEWDGRYAVYVAADIAGYEAGPARPTGGVGAVAVLVGPGAPLRLVPRTRATFAANMWDFYKPAMASEYPVVDGKLSQACYLSALDECYSGSVAKVEALRGAAPGTLGVAGAFDFLCFHSPYNKLVQQSFKRLLFNDAARAVRAGLPLPPALASLAPYAALPHAATLGNRDLDKALGALGGADYARMVGPSELLSRSIGNSYAAALHANIACLASSVGEGLAGKSIGAFSYGSGAIATMMALEGRAVPAGARFSLAGLAAQLRVGARLAARTECSPGEYAEAMAMRERAYGRLGSAPAGSLQHLAPGTFYLKDVTPAGVRSYGRK